jgi:membrane-bound lytic murein transglycosylase B
LIEILLAEGKLSDFFDNLVYLETLNTKNQELLTNIKKMKEYLEGQKQNLEEEKQDFENLVIIQALQKKESEGAKQDKNYYLKLTEAEYQKQLLEQKDIEKKAAEISHRLFELIGVTEGGIEFGEAVKIAKYVETVTGVRAAFLLAIISQESMMYGKFGANVGQCYLKNQKTGAGIVASTGKAVSSVMKPTRDVSPFLITCKKLGRDPYKTLVSCPMSYGWGGAMGPAQFIPSTWALYENRVAKITGKPADPWNINDAFLAAGLLLEDSGAAKQTYNNELNAALSYFAGPNWFKSSYKNIYIRDYGNPVMARAASFAKDIQTLEKTGK